MPQTIKLGDDVVEFHIKELYDSDFHKTIYPKGFTTSGSILDRAGLLTTTTSGKTVKQVAGELRAHASQELDMVSNIANLVNSVTPAVLN